MGGTLVLFYLWAERRNVVVVLTSDLILTLSKFYLPYNRTYYVLRVHTLKILSSGESGIPTQCYEYNPVGLSVL